MQLIAKQTVGAGGAASVTFSNIPQTYTDLKVVISVRTTNTLYGETIRIKPNGLSTNGSAIILRGYGSGTSSYTYSSVLATNNSLGNGATANTFASIEVYCPNYTSSNYKSFSADSVSENNDTNGRDELTSSLWSSTAAITSLVFDNDASYGFTEYSTFYLYGISNSTTTQNETVPYASGGDIITNDGTYWYHTFLYSGTFTPLKNLTCDYLVVAGGAGGGRNVGGGGGAGGLRSSVSPTGGGGTAESVLSLIANTAYTAQIGAGGAGTTSGTSAGINGGNSIFGSITSTGGGGGSGAGYVPENGGSGGGAGGAQIRSGGTGTANQGYAGGSVADNTGGGGGGGAGGTGSSTSINNQNGANGGSGVVNLISGSSVTYASGGGGGAFQSSTGGTGGTGAGNGGGSGASGTNATANTGSGGGGGAWINQGTGAGGNGSSGIIIVRYAV